MSAICRICFSNSPSVFGFVIMNTAVSRSSFDLKSSRSTKPSALLRIVTASKPAIAALAGFVPWALSGASTLGALLALVAEICRRHHQRRQLAMRPGGRLQRTASKPGNFGEDLLHLKQQLQHALERFLRLIRMQIGQARQRRQPFVPLRVVLHRARAERIEMRVDRHVQCRQIRIVPDNSGSANSGNGGSEVAIARGRQQFFERRLGHVV